MHASQRPQTAFTLIEIMVVVVIIAVVAAGVVPGFFRSVESLSARTAARRITDMMGFCQSMAAFQAQTFRFNVQEFDDGSFRCWVSFEKKPLESPGLFEPYRASGYGSYRLGEGIGFKSVLIGSGDAEEDEFAFEHYISFHRDGTTDGAVLVLANEKEDTFSILVSEMTGRVRIVKGDAIKMAEEQEEEEEPESDVEAYADDFPV